MELRSVVAWNIRRLRVAKAISQDDLALTAGIERAYVGYLERGKKNPTIDTLGKLAVALEVNVVEFFAEPPEGSQPVAPLKGGRKKQ